MLNVVYNASSKERFNAGIVVTCTRVTDLIERVKARHFMGHYLSRHLAGDWGIRLGEDDETWEANNKAVYQGGVITSRYVVWATEMLVVETTNHIRYPEVLNYTMMRIQQIPNGVKAIQP